MQTALRRIAAAAGAILALLALTGTAGAANGSHATRALAAASHVQLARQAALESTVLTALNQVRIDNGLVPLRLNTRLGAAADLHSREMADRGFFAHESADGSEFWK